MTLLFLASGSLLIACGEKEPDTFAGIWKGEASIVESHYNSLVKKNLVTEACNYLFDISKNNGGDNYTVKITSVNDHPISDESRVETIMGSYTATRDGDTLLVDMGYHGKAPLKLENNKIIWVAPAREQLLKVPQCVFDKQSLQK
ncbi:MAG: hypothetical protein EKK54_06135 [Neisseriaceae bacterium]|nr:MAG: hypothetical protein EKK54_06135 [Neisseriaceae bacterium]